MSACLADSFALRRTCSCTRSDSVIMSCSWCCRVR
jgi:hypothetical protein